jgi:mutual gliding-motility protein MglA
MFINWNQRELHVKIVYYGPPLSGKTTNLEQLHKRLPPDRRTDLISVKTREDRTLFFDFIQFELGQIKGLQPKFKLYTVPGQVYYAATRKLLLRDVDGLIFVADSSVSRLAANRQAIQDMWQQLSELNRDSNIPFVLQCNKQDLTDAVKPELLGRFLRVSDVPILPAVATDGQGTIETLKMVISQIVTKI